MMMKKQVLSSNEQYAGYKFAMESNRDSTRYAAQKDDAKLQDFFSRPIKIQEYSWGTETTFFQTFDPWQDFLENPRVINRLSNYNLMRADLHVRFMITGNGFHYGRILCSYNALNSDDAFTLSRGLIGLDAIQESQKPHVYLDPTNSQGGDIKCPFFWYKDALSVPSQDWRNMGEIVMRSLGQDLEHANGAIDSVTISVFAWAENVELSMPTSAEPGALSPQAQEFLVPYMEGDVYPQADEYGSSPISQPASTVARIAGMLTDAPVIGLYARATELAASAVASIAKMFGFSRPVILADIVPYVPRFMGHLAPTNMPDTAQKLSVDAKQELTIDPRVTGLGSMDELALESIASRESYLTSFTWNRTAATPETTLFSIRVTPVQFNVNENQIAFLPCALAVLPFSFWRCTMRYRFQIVASQYHKGRLRFVWDPYGFASNEFNVNYNQIVDIAEEKDFCIDIAWGSEQHFRRTGIVDEANLPFSTGLIGDAGNVLTNGVLRVVVLNELTVPNSDIPNNVTVNVFASAHNFEVGAPSSQNINNFQWFPPPPPAAAVAGDTFPQADAGPDTENTSAPSAPTQDVVVNTMGAPIQCDDYTYHVFFGEEIKSFRQMLKRYVYSETFITADGQPNSITRQFTTGLPLYPGYAPDAIHETSTSDNYNFTNTTLINWLLPNFIGWRGSIRWKLIKNGRMTAPNNSSMSVVRYPPEAGYLLTYTQFPTGASVNRSIFNNILRQTYQDTLQGAAIAPTTVQPTLEYELPFYNEERFGRARIAGLLVTELSGAPHQMIVSADHGQLANVGTRTVEKWCSVGEDFNMYYFNGVPYMYRNQDPAPG